MRYSLTTNPISSNLSPIASVFCFRARTKATAFETKIMTLIDFESRDQNCNFDKRRVAN